MVRALLITAVLAAGCYEPTFEDCTTTCSTSNLCPDGLTCTDGYCRTAGASGSCEGNMSACPPMPPLECNSASGKLEPPNCFAVCEMTGSAGAARNFTKNTWHLAVLDTPDKQAAARATVGGATVWIALLQQSNQASPATGWQWMRNGAAQPLGAMADWQTDQPDDADGTESNQQNCGALSASGWLDDDCATGHTFLVAP